MTNHEGHIALWDWLSKHPSKQKHHWPGWEKYPSADYCFACEEAICGKGTNCDFCPIEWVPGQGSGKCCGPRSPYERWRLTSSLKDKMKLAAEIRDLPWTSRR
jgi:hypothetical protein